MPVSAQTPVNSSTGNGVTTVFPYTFKILAEADILVTVDGVTKALTTDYSVSGVGNDAGGNVTFVSAPAGGTVVVLRRDMTIERTTDYQENGDLPAATLDDDIDRVVMIEQQINADITRSLKMPAGETGDQTIPSSAAERSLKLLGFDASGNLQVYAAADFPLTAVSAFVQTLLDDADSDAALGTLGINRNGFKNRLIGGDFSTNPWQRGTSFTAPATSTYLADRFRTFHVTDGVFNILKTADAPTAGQAGMFTQHCLHLDVTTPDATIAAAQYCVIDQPIEGFNSAVFGFGQAGTRYVTLSFLHKHTKTGTYCVSLSNNASNRFYISEYTQDVTNAWEKAVITVPVDTSGTWLYDSGVGLLVRFVVAAGTDWQAAANTWISTTDFATSNQVNALDSASNDFKIALVQLEAGSAATTFEALPASVVLDLCEEFCEKSFAAATAPAQNVGANTGEANFMAGKAGALADFGYVRFRKRKRTGTPNSITLYNPAAANGQVRDITAAADCSAAATANASDAGFRVTATGNAATAVGNILGVHWLADYEL